MAIFMRDDERVREELRSDDRLRELESAVVEAAVATYRAENGASNGTNTIVRTQSLIALQQETARLREAVKNLIDFREPLA